MNGVVSTDEYCKRVYPSLGQIESAMTVDTQMHGQLFCNTTNRYIIKSEIYRYATKLEIIWQGGWKNKEHMVKALMHLYSTAL